MESLKRKSKLMTDKMHIAFFTNTYMPTTSGVVRSVRTFREALTQLGHNVFVFAQQAADYGDEEPFIFRYPAISVPFLPNEYSMPIPVSSCMNQVLHSVKPDVIHSHHPFILGETAADKAEELKLPLVYTFHTRYDEYLHYMPFAQELAEKVLIDWLIKYVEKCQHIITPSESIKQILIEGGVTGPVTAVPTGIDVTPFQQADGQLIREKRDWGNDIVLISVGRLGQEKNFTTLIQAVATVITARSHVRLVIIGDGPEEKDLKKLAAKLDITQNVDFTGRIPFEDVPKYLKAADIFCFASVTETQGLVTMEAMAAGLPVVAVDATGTRDAVADGKEGLLTPNDSDALAKAIKKVVDDKALQEKFRRNVSKKVKQFDMNLQAKRLIEVYQQAIEDKNANRFIKVIT
jgi:glycosyltransferase involved in cell wall biosynthesis